MTESSASPSHSGKLHSKLQNRGLFGVSGKSFMPQQTNARIIGQRSATSDQASQVDRQFGGGSSQVSTLKQQTIDSQAKRTPTIQSNTASPTLQQASKSGVPLSPSSQENTLSPNSRQRVSIGLSGTNNRRSIQIQGHPNINKQYTTKTDTSKPQAVLNKDLSPLFSKTSFGIQTDEAGQRPPQQNWPQVMSSNEQDGPHESPPRQQDGIQITDMQSSAKKQSEARESKQKQGHDQTMVLISQTGGSEAGEDEQLVIEANERLNTLPNGSVDERNQEENSLIADANKPNKNPQQRSQPSIYTEPKDPKLLIPVEGGSSSMSVSIEHSSRRHMMTARQGIEDDKNTVKKDLQQIDTTEHDRNLATLGSETRRSIAVGKAKFDQIELGNNSVVQQIPFLVSQVSPMGSHLQGGIKCSRQHQRAILSDGRKVNSTRGDSQGDLMPVDAGNEKHKTSDSISQLQYFHETSNILNISSQHPGENEYETHLKSVESHSSRNTSAFRSGSAINKTEPTQMPCSQKAASVLYLRQKTNSQRQAEKNRQQDQIHVRRKVEITGPNGRPIDETPSINLNLGNQIDWQKRKIIRPVGTLEGSESTQKMQEMISNSKVAQGPVYYNTLGGQQIEKSQDSIQQSLDQKQEVSALPADLDQNQQSIFNQTHAAKLQNNMKDEKELYSPRENDHGSDYFHLARDGQNADSYLAVLELHQNAITSPQSQEYENWLYPMESQRQSALANQSTGQNQKKRSLKFGDYKHSHQPSNQYMTTEPYDQNEPHADEDEAQFQILQVKDPLVLKKNEVKKLKFPFQSLAQTSDTITGKHKNQQSRKRRRNINVNKTAGNQAEKVMQQQEVKPGIKVKIQYNIAAPKHEQGTGSTKSRFQASKSRRGNFHSRQTQQLQPRDVLRVQSAARQRNNRSKLRKQVQDDNEEENAEPQQMWQAVPQISAVTFLQSRLHQRRESQTQGSKRPVKQANLLSLTPHFNQNAKPSSNLSNYQQSTIKSDTPNNISLRQSQSTNLGLRGLSIPISEIDSQTGQFISRNHKIRSQHDSRRHSKQPSTHHVQKVLQAYDVAQEDHRTNNLENHRSSPKSGSRNQNLSSVGFNTMDHAVMTGMRPKTDLGNARGSVFTNSIDVNSSMQPNVSAVNRLQFRHSFLNQDPSVIKDDRIRNSMIQKRGSQQYSSGSRKQLKSHTIQIARETPPLPGYNRSSQEEYYDAQPTRMPGVSAALNQGVLPRQHQHIKQIMNIVATKSNSRTELETINDKLLKQVSNVNAMHQLMKDKAIDIKKDSKKLQEQLALRSQNSSSYRPTTSILTDKTSYNPIGDNLQQARYQHEVAVEFGLNDEIQNVHLVGVRLFKNEPETIFQEDSSVKRGSAKELIIKEKVEGARKVLDATRLRSVLDGHKSGTLSSAKSIRKHSSGKLSRANDSNPFIKNEDFYQYQQPIMFHQQQMRSVPVQKPWRQVISRQQLQAHAPQQNRFLNVFFEEKEIIDPRRQTANTIPLDETVPNFAAAKKGLQNALVGQGSSMCGHSALKSYLCSPVSQQNTLESQENAIHFSDRNRSLEIAQANQTQQPSIRDRSNPQSLARLQVDGLSPELRTRNNQSQQGSRNQFRQKHLGDIRKYAGTQISFDKHSADQLQQHVEQYEVQQRGGTAGDNAFRVKTLD